MTKLVNVANTIFGSEKAMGLYESHEQSPDSSGFHRYQIIHVIRDGKVAEWRKDMGLVSKWKGVKYLIIPALLEHTVDELLDLADELRNEKGIDVKDLLSLDKVNITS